MPFRLCIAVMGETGGNADWRGSAGVFGDGNCNEHGSGAGDDHGAHGPGTGGQGPWPLGAQTFHWGLLEALWSSIEAFLRHFGSHFWDQNKLRQNVVERLCENQCRKNREKVCQNEVKIM